MSAKKAFCVILLLANVLILALLLGFAKLNLSENLDGKSAFSEILGIVLSFEFAFFSAIFIILISFLSYKKGILKGVSDFKLNLAKNLNDENSRENLNLQNEISAKNFKNSSEISNAENLNERLNLQNEDENLKLNLQNEDENLKPNFNKFTLFFNLAKVLSYALLIISFLILQKQNFLDIFAFLGGISSVILGVLIFAFYLRKVCLN